MRALTAPAISGVKVAPMAFIENLASPLPMELRLPAVRARAPPSWRISSIVRGATRHQRPLGGRYHPRGEVGEQLGALDDAKRVDGVHADPVHLRHRHLP